LRRHETVSSRIFTDKLNPYPANVENMVS